ncbi:MAG: hypothetical protein AAGM22_08070 [Acidobacteriota bacterium]
MDRLQKLLPLALLLAVLAIGGVSVAPMEASASSIAGVEPQCDCRLPNFNRWGVLEPDPNNAGEQRCFGTDACWLPVGGG